jgi:hypothetical protein
MTPLLSPKDVARILNCSVRTALERMAEMEHMKDGGLVRVSQEELSRYIRENTRPSRDCVAKSRAASVLYEARREMRKHG